MKQDTIEGLLSNASFLFDSLFSLVNEESKRIINQKLATKKELDALVVPVLKLAANNLNKHQALHQLSNLHGLLIAVKLPNDFAKTAGFVEIEVIPTNNDMYSLKPLMKEQDHEVCCEGCGSDGPCCDIEPKSDEGEQDDEEDMELKSFLSVELEKIAHAAGLNGNHEAAYIIESFIKNIK